MREYTMVFMYNCDSQGNCIEDDLFDLVTLKGHKSIQDIPNTGVLDKSMDNDKTGDYVKFEVYYMELEGYQGVSDSECIKMIENDTVKLKEEGLLHTVNSMEFFAIVKQRDAIDKVKPVSYFEAD